MNYIFESSRIGFRYMHESDFNDIKHILADEEIMYAWGYGFTDEQVYEFIRINIRRYNRDGFGYFIAVEKESDNIIGLIGLLLEFVEDKEYIEIGYILDKKFWGRGFAGEGAKACLDFGFEQLGARKIIARIRPGNKDSTHVAEHLGMEKTGEYKGKYKEKTIYYDIYSIKEGR